MEAVLFNRDDIRHLEIFCLFVSNDKNYEDHPRGGYRHSMFLIGQPSSGYHLYERVNRIKVRKMRSLLILQCNHINAI